MKGLVILLAAVSALGLSRAQTTNPKKAGPSTSRPYTRDDVEHAYEECIQLRYDGKFKQALKLHVWYHNNALKYGSSQTGVRLSFMLRDWVELGKVFPPSLHALRSIRDETLANYKKHSSDSKLFDEVMSIDFYLDDLSSAKSLFYLGRKYGVLEDLLLNLDEIVQTGDLKWIKDVIGDPGKKLEKIKNEHAMSASALSDHPELARGNNEMFATEIAHLLKAVAKTSGKPAALKLQQQAVKILDMPEIRNALNPS